MLQYSQKQGSLGPPFSKGGGSRAKPWRVWAEPNSQAGRYSMEITLPPLSTKFREVFPLV